MDNIDPPLFQLKDLMNDVKPGYFYKEQLTKVAKPNIDTHFFEVEKVLKTKKLNNKKFYYVKFLFYSNKFNLWIPEENFKKSD